MPFTPEQMQRINAMTAPAETTSAPSASNFNPIDWTGSFFRATAEDALNIFGVDKSPETISFEKNNPLAGLAADFVGVGIPYAGWYKAAKRIKQFDNLVEGVRLTEGGGTTLLRSAASEALRFTPMEAARLASTAAINPNRLPEEAFNSALNLGLAGGFGALQGLGESYGSISKEIKDLAPNVDLNDPLTLQLRTLQDNVIQGKVAPERIDDAKKWINRFQNAVRYEQPEQGQRYISELYNNDETAHTLGVNTELTQKQSAPLNSLFNPKQSAGLAIRPLVDAGEDELGKAPFKTLGFTTPGAWQARLSSLPEGALSRMQFPRAIEVKNDGGAGAGFVRRVLQNNMVQVGEDMYMTREANGLYSVMKKIKSGGQRSVVEGPDIYYRGSNGGPDDFTDPNRLGGIFFTKDKSYAEEMAQRAVRRYGGTPTVRSYNLNINKAHPGGASPQQAKELGFDALHAGGTGSRNETVVFNKDQIRPAGSPISVGQGDEFILFKTDDPGFFGARQRAWMDRQVTRSMWFAKNAPENLPFQPGTSGGFMQNLMQTIPLRNWFDNLSKAKDESSFLQRIASTLGVSKDDNLNNAMRGIMGFAKEHFAPTLWQLNGKSGELARWLYGITRASYDRASWIADTMVYGTPRAQEGASLARQLAFRGEHVGFGDGGPALSELVNGKLSAKDKADLLQIQGGAWDSNTIEQRYLAGDISDNLHSLLQRLKTLDEKQFAELNDAELKAGVSKSTLRDAHFMLSHMWDGDWRVRIRDENGRVAYMVGAPTRGAATKQAKSIIKNAGKEGSWKFDDSHQETDDVFLKNTKSQLDDLDLLKSLNVQSRSFREASAAMEKTLKETYRPGTLKTQEGVQGYSTNMSDSAILERLHTHVRQLQTHITNLNTKTLLQGKFLQLADQNPGLMRQLNERVQNMQGRAGMFSDWQNTVLDRGLAPFLGANSATKIVRLLNTTQHNLMLGMGNIAYPLVNMMQFVQTVLPQIAYVATAPAERLGQYYNSILIHGPDNLARSPLHWLDPTKLAYQGFRIMAKPSSADQQLFGKAIEEGVFSQRAVEEHIGVDAQFKQALAGALNEKGGFVKFVQHLSEWLPKNSEKFSRLHSFTTGIAVGRDLLGMEGDNLYRFAKEFTHNTMFGYNMVDRAKVITGPLGSFAGLYKNWLMHYLGWFASYANEAIHGNFAPLVWSNLGTMGMAGIGGTAAYGVLDAASRVFGNGPAFTTVYNMFSQDSGHPDTFSDTMFYGLPAFFNVSLQGSASSFGANAAKDAASLFSIVQLERGMALGKAIGNAVATSSATGQSPFSDPLVRDQLIAALSPRAIARSAQVVEGNFLTSLQTGNPLVKGLSPAERFMYGLGFNTPGIDRMYRVSEELYNNEQSRQIATRAFARQLIELQDAGAYRELTELSRRVIASGIGMDSVLRSAQYTRERSQKDLMQYRGNRYNRSLVNQFSEQDAPSSP